MYFILLLFIFFILLLFLALAVLGGVARFLGGLFSFFRPQPGGRAAGAGPDEAEASRGTGHGRNGKKVFAADEGEYVDFEEIKDDVPERDA